VKKFSRLIEQNVAQAQYLVKRISSEHELELLAPAPLNVVCFRFHPLQSSEPRLNSINKELLLRLQESGVAVPSSTVLDGKFAIRVAVTNHRSRRADFDDLLASVLKLGEAIASDPVRSEAASG
jgi:glutamate/tyrosine decarboxylase-like PLP-dependent enzyme